MMFGGVYLRLQPNTSYLLQSSSFSTIYTGILLFEIFAMLVDLVLLLYLEYLCFYHRNFHRNLTLLISGFSALFLPAALVRTWFIFAALTGKDLAEYIPFHSAVRTTYVCLMAGSMPAAIMERTFASYYLKDYEQKDRLHVVAISVFFAISLVIGLCWDWFEDAQYIVGLCIYLLIFSITSITWFLCLWRYNCNRLKKTKRIFSDYTLSIRFQLEENLRTFKLIRTILIIIAVVFISHCCLTIFLAFHENGLLETAIQILIEFDISFLVFPVYCAFIICVPEWKHITLKLLRQTDGSNFGGDEVPRGSEGEVYFRQLANSWI